MIKVIIFHNVQRNCRECDRPVMAVGEGWAHLHLPAGEAHAVPSITMPAFVIGYQPGHAIVRVFETQVGETKDALRVAERMFQIGNIGPEFQEGTNADLAAAYRKPGLRSLAVGDVVQVGEVILHCAPVGFRRVSGKLNEVATGDWGSVPWVSK